MSTSTTSEWSPEIEEPWLQCQVVLILCGLVASGKSTFAEQLQQQYPQFHRCNQDDLGDRRRVEQLARDMLSQGKSVCIDRTNFNDSQRSHWIEIAREYPGTLIWVIVFDTPYEVCAARLQSRTSHPTIKSAEQGLSVLSRFAADFQYPADEEGHDRIISLALADQSLVYSRSQVTAILHRVHASPPVLAHRSFRPFRAPHSFRSNIFRRPPIRRDFGPSHVRMSRGRGGKAVGSMNDWRTVTGRDISYLHGSASRMQNDGHFIDQGGSTTTATRSLSHVTSMDGYGGTGTSEDPFTL